MDYIVLINSELTWGCKALLFSAILQVVEARLRAHEAKLPDLLDKTRIA